MKAAGYSRVNRPMAGLRLKVVLLLLAIQVPALAILVFESSRGIQEMANGMVRDQAFRLAQELNNRLADPSLSQEQYQEELQEFFRPLTGLRPAVAASVFLIEGDKLKCRATFGRNVRAEPTAEDNLAFGDGRTIESSNPQATVVHSPFRDSSDTVIGAIRIELDQTYTALQVMNSTRRLMVGMVIVFALSLGVLYVGMHILVVRPVMSLAQTMGRAQGGRMEAVADSSTRDEIGFLATSYNEMVHRLRALLEEKESLLGEVQDLNLNLQSRIDEATKNLAKSHRDLQKAYHDLYTSQKELQRLERLASLGQVAREIAHEFSTPLNVVSGTLQMLLEDQALKAEHRDRLKRLLGQTERLIQISRDVLTPLKMPAPELRAADLNALVEEIGAFMAPAFAARGVEFSSKLEAGLPAIRADLHQIEQVLLNLISNALDAMPGGGKIEVETAAEGPAGQRSITLRVRDDGFGIPPEHLPHIFDPFFTTKGAGKGTGLGLAICKDIVTQHRGEIRIQSTPGSGSTVTVTLPAAGPEALTGEAAA